MEAGSTKIWNKEQGATKNQKWSKEQEKLSGTIGSTGPSFGTWKGGTVWPMDLVFLSTFDEQSMSIG